jgi:hypothetical protein
MLTLLDTALRRTHEFDGEKDPDGIAWLLRIRLAAVAAGTSKVVLDAAIAGYYVQGFALIRHMLETWRQIVYVAIRPLEARRWYPAEDGTPRREPSENTITNVLRRHRPVAALAGAVEQSMRNLNEAAHPSGLALGQMATARPEHNQLGANFLEPMCLDLLARGTFANYLILRELRRDVAVPEAWRRDLAALIEETGLGWAEP